MVSERASSWDPAIEAKRGRIMNKGEPNPSLNGGFGWKDVSPSGGE
jgi:hypothetical protein